MNISFGGVSIIVVILSFALSPDKDVLTLVSSLIGVSALIFVSAGHVLGQLLTVVFAIFYGIVSFYFSYYGEMITYLCMSAPMAICAIVSWARHPYKDSSKVEINRPSRKAIIIMSISAVLVTIAFYFILRTLGTANLIFSTISVLTSYVASYLTFLRSPYYALAYSANDIVLIILWVLATIQDISYLPMILCFVMFLVNDLYGFVNWKRMQKSQEE